MRTANESVWPIGVVAAIVFVALPWDMAWSGTPSTLWDALRDDQVSDYFKSLASDVGAKLLTAVSIDSVPTYDSGYWDRVGKTIDSGRKVYKLSTDLTDEVKEGVNGFNTDSHPGDSDSFSRKADRVAYDGSRELVKDLLPKSVSVTLDTLSEAGGLQKLLESKGEQALSWADSGLDRLQGNADSFRDNVRSDVESFYSNFQSTAATSAQASAIYTAVPADAYPSVAADDPSFQPNSTDSHVGAPHILTGLDKDAADLAADLGFQNAHGGISDWTAEAKRADADTEAWEDDQAAKRQAAELRRQQEMAQLQEQERRRQAAADAQQLRMAQEYAAKQAAEASLAESASQDAYVAPNVPPQKSTMWSFLENTVNILSGAQQLQNALRHPSAAPVPVASDSSAVFDSPRKPPQPPAKTGTCVPPAPAPGSSGNAEWCAQHGFIH